MGDLLVKKELRMSEGQRPTLLAYLHRLGSIPEVESSDAHLLERFARQRDEAAFASLMRRHGPLVWGVCRRVLAQEQAAEDAFQATFLVLVRKARSVSKRASVRSWLYGVALRVAVRARQREGLRRLREQNSPRRPAAEKSPENTWDDLRPILDEEIQRLPEKYRLPIILCYLEGQTNDAAARQLNCPRGTLAIRLARARERLRSRLIRRGLTLSAGSLATLLAENATSATVLPLLFAQTAEVVLMGAASDSITSLTGGVLHAMFVSKLKMASALVLMLAAIGGVGMGAYYLHAQDSPKPKELLPEDANNPPKELDKPLKRPDVAAPGKKAPGKAEDRLHKLLLARRDIAEEEWKARSGLYRVGANEPGTGGSPVTLPMLLDTAKRLLKAELELSANKAERLKAREKYLNRAKEVVDITEAQYKAGRLGKSTFASALYEQLDAEIELEREKLRK
jgi:RNA polymerase sigma factor (sigma-70 family)